MSPFLRQFTPQVLLPRLQQALFGTASGRVLHLGVDNMYGGIETTLVTIARNRHLMPNVDFHAAVFFEGRLRQSLEETGLSVPVLGAMRYRDPLSVMRARRNLADLLDRLRPDVVCSHSCWTQGLVGPTLRRKRVRLASWMHSPPSGSWIEWFASRAQPDLVIVNSFHTATHMGRLFKGVPISVIYPVCDILGQPDAEKLKVELRTSLNCPTNRKVILIAARFDQCKGHLVLLDSLARLREPDWECWIAGGATVPSDLKLRDLLQAQAGRMGIAGRLRWLGHRSDVLALCAAADLFCQPNVEPESFGHVFVEAQAMGCPVVTTAMGGALENVETGGRNRLVPRPDAALVAAAMDEVLAGAGTVVA
ncbi:MAG: glycosyltransferase [Planctomycetota bacterium]